MICLAVTVDRPGTLKTAATSRSTWVRSSTASGAALPKLLVLWWRLPILQVSALEVHCSSSCSSTAWDGSIRNPKAACMAALRVKALGLPSSGSPLSCGRVLLLLLRLLSGP